MSAPIPGAVGEAVTALLAARLKVREARELLLAQHHAHVVDLAEHDGKASWRFARLGWAAEQMTEAAAELELALGDAPKGPRK